VTAPADLDAPPTGSLDADARRDDPPLDALLEALERLEAAIVREAAALAANDTAPLLAAVDDKRRALASVEALIRLPSLAALLADVRGREAAAVAHSPAWPRILEKLEACRAANEAVGSALAAVRRSTETSLKWLGLAGDDGTYTHRGAGRGPASRDLAVC